ncbi:bifunctional methylenetetrahydrofolate dehydrogenase/methenyltetrahydrofolate cyclohydrolase [Carnobacterium maltaromaticum]|uniref:Bifunctional protein FolD n=2 Tax=Carnobacteriaceae TaxID=186828 RepID=K8EIF5_CARML|nr:bifunctional methylenetetrahydrofolate dehydrogenase/methenyltetrahydrofolate cyclohydrolase [Carnobacterium maltaromaticum]CCO11633.2 tetrahydrofolate dehydrogenase/cyclohydrolase,catalytic domain protein [Carnobacterium maltaromaticum LMA28]TFJ31141.1 bifunctional methylenetetrahydrofolate dehydrogenase/methenyltetrahydrofolate cyclohydrolase [Carnobacterium maltaromaticum]TFJ34598.1 bifunctional methylenetetrahydrofolate dehydrogenase/methenyltetrahydrofolate cyclohydrolase [Carnobacterium
MSAIIMDGKGLADEMQVEMFKTVEGLKEKGITPGLVVLLVGENPASQTYVKNKEKRAVALGFNSLVKRLPESISEKELVNEIEFYNQNPDFHGILVQLPLPNHIDAETILNTIDPSKDVDGFHPVNMGKLLIGQPDMIPCTPYGIMKLLARYKIDIAGKNAVIIGRSNIVGKPMAQLLLMEHATVTIAHSKTANLAELAKTADILVVAIGRGHFVTKEFIKPGAVVIDVGMNRDQNGKLIGDVASAEVAEVAGYLTPVPKGVGPMTITMLLYQTIKNAEKQVKSF